MNFDRKSTPGTSFCLKKACYNNNLLLRVTDMTV